MCSTVYAWPVRDLFWLHAKGLKSRGYRWTVFKKKKTKKKQEIYKSCNFFPWLCLPSVIVDPYLECAETEPNKPVEELNKVLEKYEQQFTPRWLGVGGDDHTPR